MSNLQGIALDTHSKVLFCSSRWWRSELRNSSHVAWHGHARDDSEQFLCSATLPICAKNLQMASLTAIHSSFRKFPSRSSYIDSTFISHTPRKKIPVSGVF